MTAQLSIRVDEAMQVALAAEAARQRRTTANLVRLVLADWTASRGEWGWAAGVCRPRRGAGGMRAICEHCGRAFEARRSTARYCTPAHRLAAYRGLPAQCLPQARGAVQDAIVSVSGPSDTPKPDRRLSESRETLKAPKLPVGIVADARWPGMYRVQLSDGLLSDMVNLTRAKDVVRALGDQRRRAG